MDITEADDMIDEIAIDRNSQIINLFRPNLKISIESQNSTNSLSVIGSI